MPQPSTQDYFDLSADVSRDSGLRRNDEERAGMTKVGGMAVGGEGGGGYKKGGGGWLGVG